MSLQLDTSSLLLCFVFYAEKHMNMTALGRTLNLAPIAHTLQTNKHLDS